MTIELLGESAYQGWLEATPSPGIEATHIGRIHLGEPLRMYVKLYPDHMRGLVNEITYQLIAAALQLPVPRRCAVVLVPVDRLRQIPGWLPTNVDSWPARCLPGPHSADPAHNATSPATRGFFLPGDRWAFAGGVVLL
jgi:hypothetical protein